MIVFITTIMLLVVFIVPIFHHKKRGKDTFSPEIMVCILHIISIIPYLLYVSINPEAISPLVRYHYTFKGVEETVLYYAFIQTIAFIFLQIGLRKSLLLKKKLRSFLFVTKESKKLIIITFYLTFFVGILSYIYLISKLGGIQYILHNMHRRTQILAGNSYIMTIKELLPLSVLLYIYSFRYRKRTIIKYFNIVVLILLVIVMSSLFGGRKGSIHFLIASLLVWHYGVKHMKLFSPKLFILIPFLAIYFIAMPLLRVPGAVENFTSNRENFYLEVQNNAETLIQHTSYVDHYLLIMNYFETDRIWLGSSYLDLIKAPIPSSIYPDKPPVDDGVYLRTIASGVDVKPSTPYNNMFKSSWPPETLGIMYMNFWIPGVIIGMYILGKIYKTAYMYLTESNYSLYSIIIYSKIITNFHLSNLRITQTLIDIIFYTLFFMIFFGLIRSNNKPNMQNS